MASSIPIILVTGGTGDQGGATARALSSPTCQVRALVRDPSSDAAIRLKQLNVTLYKGEFDDMDSLVRAMTGATGLFLNTSPSFDSGAELRHAQNLLKAAAEVGTITHVVYSSVNLTGQHERFPGWGPDHPSYHYWITKHQIECAVRDANFRFWTILRPAFFMGNYLLPKAAQMFPQLAAEGHSLVSIYRPEFRMVLVDENDIGRFAAAAYLEPGKFAKKEISLGVEALTTQEIATALSHASGTDVKAENVDFETAAKRGIYVPVLEAQKMVNEVPYEVDFESLKVFSIKMTKFSEYLEREQGKVQRTLA